MVSFPDLSRLASRREGRGLELRLRRYALVGSAGVVLGLFALLGLGRHIAAMFHVPAALWLFLVAFSALALLGVFSTISGFLLQAWGEEARAAKLSLATLLLACAFHVPAVSAWGLWGVVAAGGAAELRRGLGAPRRRSADFARGAAG